MKLFKLFFAALFCSSVAFAGAGIGNSNVVVNYKVSETKLLKAALWDSIKGTGTKTLTSSIDLSSGCDYVLLHDTLSATNSLNRDSCNLAIDVWALDSIGRRVSVVKSDSIFKGEGSRPIPLRLGINSLIFSPSGKYAIDIRSQSTKDSVRLNRFWIAKREVLTTGQGAFGR